MSFLDTLLLLYLPMGLNGLEPSTSRLSGVRSNQLSYRPVSSVSFPFSEVLPSKLNNVFPTHVLCRTSLSIPTLRLGSLFLRKEVIQPQVLLRLPCYDFTLIICPALDG